MGPLPKNFLALILLLLTIVPDLAMAKSSQGNRRRHTRETRPCMEPPTSELLGQLSSPMELHSSFYQFPPLQGSVTTLDRFKAQHVNMTKIQYSNLNTGSGSCDGSRAAGDPCPMIWRFNHDDNRYPQTMVDGECLSCPSCSRLLTDDSTMGCTPIHYHMKVLRKTGRCDPATNHFLFVEVYEPVTVGCACRTKSRRATGRILSVHSRRH